MAEALSIPSEKITELCRRWKVRRLWLFGSCARGDQSSASDVDLLVEFLPNAGWSYFELFDLEDEFSALVGRKADLRTVREIETNPVVREHVNSDRKELYAA